MWTPFASTDQKTTSTMLTHFHTGTARPIYARAMALGGRERAKHQPLGKPRGLKLK